jgi:aminopeptidase N
MWNEAFANYSDELYWRFGKAAGRPEDESNSAVAQRLEARRNSTRQYAAMPVALAFNTEDEVQNSVGYNKGAQVLRALEEQIGAEAMQSAMRSFVTHHTRGEAAEWSEFEAAASRAAGQDLHWFFQQWLERPGLPSITVSNVDARREGGDVVVSGRIRQLGAVYRLRLPVAIELRSGEVIRQILETQGPDTPFRMRIQGAPDRFILDPDAVMPIAPSNDANTQGDPFTFTFQ